VEWRGGSFPGEEVRTIGWALILPGIIDLRAHRCNKIFRDFRKRLL